jgi:hypothetical protein
LVGHLRVSLSEIMPRLPSGSRAEFLLRLQEFAHKPSMIDVKPDLEALVNRLRKTGDKDNDSQR